MIYDIYRDHLAHFICQNSWSAENLPLTLTHTVGGVVCPITDGSWTTYEFSRSAGYESNGFSTQLVSAEQSGSTGSYVKIKSTDDALIILSGRAAAGFQESGSIFRLGQSGAGTPSKFRLRLNNTEATIGRNLVAGELVDVSVAQDMGPYQTDLNDDADTTVSIPSTCFEIDEDGMVAIAIDRTRSQIHSHAYSYELGRSRYDGGDLPSYDGAIGALTCLNDDASGTLNTFSLQGVIYGAAVYVFPNNTLPSDWREKAVELGAKWRAGNFERAITAVNSIAGVVVR